MMSDPKALPVAGLPALLHGRAQRAPDAQALAALDREPMTYLALWRQVEYTCGVLRRYGIGADDTVAVVLPNGAEMAAAFLGVAASAICAPLNAAYSSDQFRFYLSDLQACALILPAGEAGPARDVAAELGIRLIELAAAEEPVAGVFRLGDFEGGADGAATWSDDPDTCALVLHTSGTTSRPKQVPLSQSNLLASAGAIAGTLELTADDRCLNVMPLFHIHGLVGVLLASVYAGASVACMPGYQESDFPDQLTLFDATWYSAVPTIHQSVLALAERDPSVTTAGRLRFLRSSSASLPPPVMERLEACFNVPVIEAYGMTEAAHQMASNPLPPGRRKPGSVGLPAGPDIAIMGEGGRLLAADEIGEIVIRGANVTAGYRNNDEANATAFTDGWFRTGDLGRMDRDGYLYVTGRSKEMINRGGESIAPREIDDALSEHPAVAQAVAFAVPHATLGEDIAVAVVLREGEEASEQDLRAFAFEKLAPSMVPTRVVLVDAIPKGSTGKLKRIGLHELLADALRQAHVEPRDAIEQCIVDRMGEVLGTPPPGVTDNFFALGGDSLNGTRLIAALCTDFQVDLPAVAVFHHPTAAELALEITHALAGDADTLERLLEEVEAMSEDDIRRQLD
jgi:acyl-CoA synthetase (AMP-forming)/AMP-acid ligase II/acyl carrier protein